MTPESFSLRIERSFGASRAQIFRAFTEPALRSQWLRPGDDWSVPATELDPRVGGGVLEPAMLVAIDLHDLGDGKTRLVLEQSGYRERKNRDEQEQGWPALLDQLAKLLARP